MITAHIINNFRSIVLLQQAWSGLDRKEWHYDKDEVLSANKLINDAEDANIVELSAQEGIVALAYVIPSLLRSWAGRIKEILLDSACA